MCSGVGYGKMDYPTQQVIYHCQRGRGTERVGREERREGEPKREGKRRKRKDGMKGLGKDR